MKLQDVFSTKNSKIQGDLTNHNDIINILMKQKKSIFITIFITSLCTIAYFLLLKPVYESRAMIVIGNIILMDTRQPILIEEAPIFIQRIKGKYHVGSSIKESGEPPALVYADFDKKTTNIITLKVHANSPIEAQEYLANVVTTLIDEHQSIYSNFISLQKEQIFQLEQELDDVEKEINEYSKQSRMMVRQDGAMAALLFMEKVKRGERRVELQKQIAEIKVKVSKVYIRPTEIVMNPTLELNPTKSKSLIVAAALVLGIMLSIIVALVKENFESKQNY